MIECNMVTVLREKVASPRGFEPPASGLGILRSIRLSYGDVNVSGVNVNAISITDFIPSINSFIGKKNIRTWHFYVLLDIVYLNSH